jgi:hypothetical protein
VARCYFSSTVSQILLHGLTGGQLLILGNYFTGGSGGVIFTTGIANTIQANVFDAIGGDAMSFTTGYGNVLGNSVYAPLGHGLTWSSTPSGGCHVANNHFENVNQASKAAINNGSGTASGLIRPVGNSYYQCTSNVAGQGDNPNIFDVGTLAGSGFVNAAGHDFTPSALLLAKGFPGQFENISAFRGYMNPGALQSQASSGGGGGYLVGGGLVR